MLRLRDLMTTDLVTLDPHVSIREAMDALASKRISGVPVAGDEVVSLVYMNRVRIHRVLVIDEGTLVGLVTTSDIT